MVMHLWQPLSGWDFRAGQYLTVSGLKPGGTSDISHIHSTETAHFSPFACAPLRPDKCNHIHEHKTQIPVFFCCACVHTHMKSQIQAPHLFLYIIKITVKVFSLPRLRSIDKVRWTYAALLMESSSLRHLLLPGRQTSSSLFHQASQRLLIIITKFHWPQAVFIWDFKWSWQAVKAWSHQKLSRFCWAVTENK